MLPIRSMLQLEPTWDGCRTRAAGGDHRIAEAVAGRGAVAASNPEASALAEFDQGQLHLKKRIKNHGCFCAFHC